MQQKGVALVLVLWVLSLLIVMAGSFALSMRRETSIVSTIKNNAQAMSVAESVISIAEMMLLNPDLNRAWRADGRVYELIALNAKVRIQLTSEGGKIDINKADQRLLQGLMAHAPIDEGQQNKIVGAILDWRDNDDLVNLNGAEKDEYQEAGLNYLPANKPFQSIEELQLLLGMDKDVFLWIEPLVTVYSGQAQINLQMASKEVLQVIPGLDQGLIYSYVSARLRSAINNQPPPPFPITSVFNDTSGQNNVFNLRSEAVLDDHSKATINIVIKKSEENPETPFQVLKWQHVTVNNMTLFTAKMSDLLVKQYAEPELNN
jgi:general secretion pathway protein K